MPKPGGNLGQSGGIYNSSIRSQIPIVDQDSRLTLTLALQKHTGRILWRADLSWKERDQGVLSTTQRPSLFDYTYLETFHQQTFTI